MDYCSLPPILWSITASIALPNTIIPLVINATVLYKPLKKYILGQDLATEEEPHNGGLRMQTAVRSSSEYIRFA